MLMPLLNIPNDTAKASLLTMQAKLEGSWATLLELRFLWKCNTTCQIFSKGGACPPGDGARPRCEGLRSRPAVGMLGVHHPAPCHRMHGAGEGLRNELQNAGARTPHRSTCSVTLGSPQVAKKAPRAMPTSAVLSVQG